MTYYDNVTLDGENLHNFGNFDHNGAVYNFTTSVSSSHSSGNDPRSSHGKNRGAPIHVEKIYHVGNLGHVPAGFQNGKNGHGRRKALDAVYEKYIVYDEKVGHEKINFQHEGDAKVKNHHGRKEISNVDFDDSVINKGFEEYPVQKEKIEYASKKNLNSNQDEDATGGTIHIKNLGIKNIGGNKEYISGSSVNKSIQGGHIDNDGKTEYYYIDGETVEYVSEHSEGVVASGNASGQSKIARTGDSDTEDQHESFDSNGRANKSIRNKGNEQNDEKGGNIDNYGKREYYYFDRETVEHVSEHSEGIVASGNASGQSKIARTGDSDTEDQHESFDLNGRANKSIRNKGNEQNDEYLDGYEKIHTKENENVVNQKAATKGHGNRNLKNEGHEEQSIQNEYIEYVSEGNENNQLGRKIDVETNTEDDLEDIKVHENKNINDGGDDEYGTQENNLEYASENIKGGSIKHTAIDSNKKRKVCFSVFIKF